jgi:hypothetical protein
MRPSRDAYFWLFSLGVRLETAWRPCHEGIQVADCQPCLASGLLLHLNHSLPGQHFGITSISRTGAYIGCRADLPDLGAADRPAVSHLTRQALALSSHPGQDQTLSPPASVRLVISYG